MPLQRWKLRGLAASQHNTEGLVAIMVAHEAVTGSHHVFLLRTAAANTFIGFLDDLAANGEHHRDLPIEAEWMETWETYPDTFMTEASARKYAQREMNALRQAGAEKEPYYNGDVSLDAKANPTTEAMKATIRGDDLMVKVSRPARKRFDDDDDAFAAKFAAKERMEAMPRPSAIGRGLVAEDDAGIPPVRLVSKTAAGGKFWEISVVERPLNDKPWHVNVRFGAIGDLGQERNVAKCGTKGVAMDVRRERINKKRRKGYTHATLTTVSGREAS